MIAKAVSKYLRLAPRKAMLITRPLKGASLPRAYELLANVNKKAAYFVNMTLKSAVDNARKKDRHIDESNLYISKIVADGGPMLKRLRAGSMGRAFTIRKRTCHLTVELDTKERPKAEVPRAKKAAAPKIAKPKEAKPQREKRVGNAVRKAESSNGTKKERR
jgi:large subunit ribosomal protein L22